MQNSPLPSPPTYPAVEFLLRHGAALSIVVGLLPLAAAVWLAVTGAPLAYAVAAVVAAPLLYLLMRSYVELVTIIADMLLPK